MVAWKKKVVDQNLRCDCEPSSSMEDPQPFLMYYIWKSKLACFSYLWLCDFSRDLFLGSFH